MIIIFCLNPLLNISTLHFPGGDREPPEHGLKKYWKESKQRKDALNPNFSSQGGILQQAANMAGLSTISGDSLVPNTTQPPPQKKAKRERKPKNTVQNTIENHGFVSSADGCIKTELIQSGNANGIIQTNEDVNLQSLTGGFNSVQTNDPTSSMHNLSQGNMQNLSTTILQLNNSAAGQGFITIPTALAAGSTITIPNCLSLQTIQQQLQQQQQLQLQIQLLQQQLQASQAASQNTFAAAAAAADPDYMINVSGSPEQSAVASVVSPLNGSPGDGIVKQPLMGSTDANQTLSSINVVETDTVLPRVVTNTQNLLLNQEGLSLINTPHNVKQQGMANAVSLLSSPTSSADVINSYQPVTLITAPSPTMAAVSQQPVTISLQQNTPLSISNLPTMLTLGPHTVSQPHQITIGPQTIQQTQQQQQIIVQTNTVSAQPAPSFNSTPATMLLTPSGVQPLITSTSLNPSPSTVLLAQSVVQAQPLVHTVVQQQPMTQTIVQQQPLSQNLSRTVVQAPPSITLNNNAQPMLIAQTTSEPGIQHIRTAPQIIVNTGSTNSMRVSSALGSNIQTSTSTSSHPVSSFNADSFLSGESSYAVLSNANMAQIQPRQTDSSNLRPMQVSFIQTS